MREALRGLTGRGRAFAAAGLTAVVCSIFLDQQSLARVGVLVVVLPLATAFVVGRSKYRLALGRTVSPQVVAAGQPARVTLTVSNEGRTPSGVLLLEDQVPYVLGTRPRFVVDGIGRGWRRAVTYQVRSDVRGRFEIGPMSVRVSDPFGLVELGRAFRGTVPLVVTPRVVDLPPVPLTGGWTGSGDNRPRAFAVGSAEDVTVRQYRRGDDLRRVHWRSSARTGDLMVRREEQPWQARATVLLDNRRTAHRGEGAAGSFESAVVAAASVAVHLCQRGFAVRLVTADGEAGGGHDHDAARDAGRLLETLAVLDVSPARRLDTGWLGEATRGGLAVAVLGHVDGKDSAALARVRHHTSVALALTLDVDAWSQRARPVATAGADTGGGARQAPPAPGQAVVVQAGWRSASWGPRDRLEPVWEELGGRAAVRPPGVSATTGLLLGEPS